jgi:hypothetical protein
MAERVVVVFLSILLDSAIRVELLVGRSHSYFTLLERLRLYYYTIAWFLALPQHCEVSKPNTWASAEKSCILEAESKKYIFLPKRENNDLDGRR